jgi:hypothetical protein
LKLLAQVVMVLLAVAQAAAEVMGQSSTRPYQVATRPLLAQAVQEQQLVLEL